MLHKKHLCGKEKLEKKWKEELIKSQQGALEKFVFKMVDTQEVCINAIILNERFFFLLKVHKRSGTALYLLLLSHYIDR
jgi:hypothetical protein